MVIVMLLDAGDGGTGCPFRIIRPAWAGRRIRPVAALFLKML